MMLPWILSLMNTPADSVIFTAVPAARAASIAAPGALSIMTPGIGKLPSPPITVFGFSTPGAISLVKTSAAPAPDATALASFTSNVQPPRMISTVLPPVGAIGVQASSGLAATRSLVTGPTTASGAVVTPSSDG